MTAARKKVYKHTTLERYGAAGYLDLGFRGFTAIDRIGAGKRLYTDYYLGGIERVSAVDVSRIQVDGGGNTNEPLFCLHHRDCYEKAIAAIPEEFWPVVRRVCIEDEEIKAIGTAKEVKRILYANRMDLCRGLDRLIKFYRKGG